MGYLNYNGKGNTKWIICGVAVVAGWYLYKNWETVKGWFTKNSEAAA